MKPYLLMSLTAVVSLLATARGAGKEHRLSWNPGNAWTEYVTEANVDLSGSGHIDHVRLDPVPAPGGSPGVDGGVVSLSVNDDAFINFPGNRLTVFFIAAVDRRDRHREIVVRVIQEDDAERNYLFWYDGKRLTKMGYVGNAPCFRGDGTLTAQTHEGFWNRTDNYALRRDHTVKLVDRDFYPVNKTSYVERPLNLIPRREDDVDEVSAIVPRNHRVRLLYADGNDWYRVRADNGESGWITQAEACTDLDFVCLP